MASSPLVAVYDACVLYPFQLRNLLVQLAADRLVDARWSDDIHDEWIRNLLKKEPRLTRERLERTRDLMNSALPNATVTGYAARIPGISLRDPDDRHVVAAAVEGGAQVIVTWNVRDFPVAELKKHGLRKLNPDAFLMELHAAHPDAVASSVENARRNLTASKIAAADYLTVLERQKLKRFTAILRARGSPES
ncbi:MULTISPECIES: PIN domain-containing protein [unclassified Phenylobacterium]|uniref:PIN domain-containing protein n=1 Tax=unclassified Phenylobacterium TaxID=2640670 RepID=UPI00083ADD40|nr:MULTISPECIES: PIN domain-containing protein [unclassified Phenylobacterium]